jgi:hypothetical protein
VITQATCSKLNSRLAFLSDTLVSVSRRLAISIDAKKASHLVARVGADLYDSRNDLLVLYHQFTSGYLWGCVPKEDLSSLISNFTKMKLFDNLDYRKFQCLYLAVDCVLSLSNFYQERAISCQILEKLMQELRVRLPFVLSTSLSMLDTCRNLQKSPHHVRISRFIGNLLTLLLHSQIRQSIDSLLRISLSVDRGTLDPVYVDQLFKSSISIYISWIDSSVSRDFPWFTGKQIE